MKLSNKQQSQIQYHFSQGQQSISIKLWDVALKHFKAIIEISPMDVLGLAHLAFVYASTKEHPLAIETLKKLLLTGQNLAQTHFNLGSQYFALKQHKEAIGHYQKCLQLNKRTVEAMIDCAICHRELKEYESAIELLHSALNLDTKNARALQALGLTYADKEDFNKALNCLEDAVGLAPSIAEYRMSFANILSKSGFTIDATHQWHKACESNPNLSEAFIGYGQFLYNVHGYDEALECYQRALELNPNDLRVVDNMGENYAGMADIDNALKYYDIALTKEPNRFTSLNGKAKLFLEHGKTDELESVIDILVNTHPEQPEGYIHKARAKKSKPDDGIAETLKQFTNHENRSTRAWVNFILGKVYDDQNNFEMAFNHYKIGNDLRNSLLEYTQESDKNEFDEIIHTFDADLFDKLKDIGSDSEFPIFIVGMPRSATTLTEQIISSHPKVMAAGEVSFWGKANISMPIVLGTQTSYPQCAAETSKAKSLEIANLYESTLRKITGGDNRIKHITDKMPHNFKQIGLIHLMFPNAKIIHTKRNPIDNCLSVYFQHFNDYHSYSFNLENLAFHYRQYERLMAHWHKVLPDRVLDINYEDTIADPEYWTRKLIDYVGLEWDDACLAPHKLERSVKTASVWQVRQPIYKTSVERWRNYETYIQPLIEGLNKPIAD